MVLLQAKERPGRDPSLTNLRRNQPLPLLTPSSWISSIQICETVISVVLAIQCAVFGYYSPRSLI